MQHLTWLNKVLATLSRLLIVNLCPISQEVRAGKVFKFRVIRLKPVQGIASLSDEEKFDWRGADGNAEFLASRPYVHLARGYYRLELCIRTEMSLGVARLYVNYGGRSDSWETISVPFISGRLQKRQVLFRRQVFALRFAPLEGEAAFKIEKLALCPSLAPYAYTSMLNRLLGMDFGTSGQKYRRKAFCESLAVEAKERGEKVLSVLYRRYSQTFTHGGDRRVEYAGWVKEAESKSWPIAEEVTACTERVSCRPLFSVVVLVRNTPEHFLRTCLDSILAQSYGYWELCIACDASSEPHVHAVLAEYATRTQRICVIYQEQNGHISSASNRALSLAQGEYVALLDYDGVLAEHALYYMAEAINENPDAQLLYSDEDKIDADGGRFDPHFKSDWNPDLLFSQNYVSHLSVYRRALLNRIGGFCVSAEGCQDHDLLLRCLPHMAPKQILHIPRILYHWQAVEGSTALALGEKNYTTAAGIKALCDFFASKGPEGVIVEAGHVSNTYRMRWPIPDPSPLVSLLIPTRDKRKLIEACVRSILGMTTYQNYEILILDNGSVEEDTLEFLESISAEDHRVHVLRYDYAFNYSAINNFGVQQAKGSVIGLINNDIEVISPEWLTEMVSHAIRPEIGCVGAKLYYDDETIQHAGVVLGVGGVAGHSHKYFNRDHPGYFSRLLLVQNVAAVTGACLLVRRETYEAVGGLNEVDLKVAFNDVDFCLKVRESGYRNLWTPYAELYHHESKSRGEDDTRKKYMRFRSEAAYMCEKWGDSLLRDPYYNPNLTLISEDFSLGVVHVDAVSAS